MNFFDCAADHARSRNIFVRAENVFGFVVAIDVGGGKIHGNVFFFAVREETVHPSCLCGGGAADAEAGGDTFDGTSGVVVELVVGVFARIAGPEVDVGLVPDFEIPLGDFVDAVALDEMA